MATNIIKSKNPKWIQETYKAGYLIQPVINRLPPEPSEVQVENAVLESLKRLEPEKALEISAHLTGDAFDIAPMLDVDGLPSPEGFQIIDFIRRDLVGSKMLLKEGGLIRWHVQFPRTITTEV